PVVLVVDEVGFLHTVELIDELIDAVVSPRRGHRSIGAVQAAGSGRPRGAGGRRQVRGAVAAAGAVPAPEVADGVLPLFLPRGFVGSRPPRPRAGPRASAYERGP